MASRWLARPCSCQGSHLCRVAWGLLASPGGFGAAEPSVTARRGGWGRESNKATKQLGKSKRVPPFFSSRDPVFLDCWHDICGLEKGSGGFWQGRKGPGGLCKPRCWLPGAANSLQLPPLNTLFVALAATLWMQLFLISPSVHTKQRGWAMPLASPLPAPNFHPFPGQPHASRLLPGPRGMGGAAPPWVFFWVWLGSRPRLPPPRASLCGELGKCRNK